MRRVVVPGMRVRSGAASIASKGAVVVLDATSLARALADAVARRNGALLAAGFDPDDAPMPTRGQRTMGYDTGHLAESIRGELVRGDAVRAEAIVTGPDDRERAIRAMAEAGKNPLAVGWGSRADREAVLAESVESLFEEGGK